MNRLKTLKERSEATRQLIENELYLLREKGYNPITGYFTPIKQRSVEPKISFLEALNHAYDLLNLTNTTKLDVKSSIKYFEIVSKKIGFDKTEIQDVKRRHLIQMFEILPTLKNSCSAWSHNNCRTYLKMLFKKLLLLDTIETNPVRDIPKEEVPEKLKKVLTREQRIRVYEYLLKIDPDFQRIING